MPGLLGGGGAAAGGGGMVTPGGGLGGAPAGGGGLGRLNPYFGQLNPDEKKAAALRMMMANLGEMDFNGGVNAPNRPRTFGLGELDAVVNESYQRAEREKAWEARERAEKQQEERYLTQLELREKDLERQARDRQRAEKERMDRLKMSREDQQMQRERFEWQRQQQEQQEKAREELEALLTKYPDLTPQERARYRTLGGVDPSMNAMMGLGGFGVGGLGGAGVSRTPEEILRAGVGQFR